MQKIELYRSMDGKLYQTQETALYGDFCFLRKEMVDRVKFLSVHRDFDQFHDLVIMGNKLRDKHEEYRRAKNKA